MASMTPTRADAWNNADDGDMSTIVGNGRASIDISRRIASGGGALPSATVAPPQFIGGMPTPPAPGPHTPPHALLPPHMAPGPHALHLPHAPLFPSLAQPLPVAAAQSTWLATIEPRLPGVTAAAAVVPAVANALSAAWALLTSDRYTPEQKREFEAHYVSTILPPILAAARPPHVSPHGAPHGAPHASHGAHHGAPHSAPAVRAAAARGALPRGATKTGTFAAWKIMTIVAVLLAAVVAGVVAWHQGWFKRRAGVVTGAATGAPRAAANVSLAAGARRATSGYDVYY